jgi:gamma-glutamyl hercynylcysteine S-oxide synthase
MSGINMKAITPRLSISYFIPGVIITALLFGTVVFIFESKLNKPILIGAVSIGFVYVLVLGRSNRWKISKKLLVNKQNKLSEEAAKQPRRTVAAHVPTARLPVDPNDIDALVEQMLVQDRYALLLRPQIAGNLNEAQFGQALSVLGECMALVPDGEVQLEEGDTSRIMTVQRFFFDRYPVTNRQYYEFVAAGGYRQASLWDESVLPGVLEFVDRTGHPGPKYWENGCYQDGKEQHPVTGISWYEADAYARWVGKRLPSDAEWVKAGSWPVRISSTTQVQRKYPWGDSMDRVCANIWGSGPNDTVPVDQYPSGVSAGGVYQLIGNVWEWTTSYYNGASLPRDHLPMSGIRLSTPLRSIRGGAFDTYFDNQASCQFQSGEIPLNRRNNIGFRCVVGVCDLTLVRQPAPSPETQKVECSKT